MSLFSKVMATESALDSVVFMDEMGLLVQEASEGVYTVQGGGGNLPDLAFQRGFHGEVGINGYTNELLLAVLIHRTERLNDNCPSEFNTVAIDHMHSALQAFAARKQDREQRGVEGTTQE